MSHAYAHTNKTISIYCPNTVNANRISGERFQIEIGRGMRVSFVSFFSTSNQLISNIK